VNHNRLNRLLGVATIVFPLTLPGCGADRLLDTEGSLVPRTVDLDASIPAISINGSRFHAESFGAPGDPMLIVLHGGPGADYRYLLRCREFADLGYFVVFYDQRGSGLSRRERKSSYSIQVMLDDLEAVIAHYRTSPEQKVILLGHSWGAMLATAYIDQHPAAINGAILAEPGGFVWQDIKDYVGRTHEFSPLSETLNDATWLDQFLTGGEDEQAILDYKFGLLSYTDGAKDSPLGNEAALPFWRAGATVNQALFDLGEKEQPDWTTHLSHFTTPVLFVYSERNRAYGPDHARRVSSAFPNVELRRIDGAGHDMLTFPVGWNNFRPIALSYLDSRVK
jgi:proline iminopeptidase